MWTCPKCGREFKRTNQGHYCGQAPVSVDEYIESLTPEAKKHAAELRSIILRCTPDAVERIAWSMPTYKKGARTVSFAACRRHISLYVESAAMDAFKQQFSEFTIRKNAIYLPYDKALPLEAIENIAAQSFA